MIDMDEYGKVKDQLDSNDKNLDKMYDSMIEEIVDTLINGVEEDSKKQSKILKMLSLYITNHVRNEYAHIMTDTIASLAFLVDDSEITTEESDKAKEVLEPLNYLANNSIISCEDELK